mgnify:CR=1 FL=1
MDIHTKTTIKGEIYISMRTLRVATDSKPASVAGALIATLKEEKEKVALQAMGAGAVNQAVKAIAAARNFLASDESEVDLAAVPAFADIKVEGKEKTAIKLIVETREKEE